MISVFFSIFLNKKDTRSFNFDDLSLFNCAFEFEYSGWVHLDRELISNVRCPMDFHDYPHDTHICKMRFESYFYSEDKFMFANASVNVAKSAFDSSSYKIEVYDLVTKSSNEFGAKFLKKFHVVDVTINFKRRQEFYIYQVCFFYYQIFHQPFPC